MQTQVTTLIICNTEQIIEEIIGNVQLPCKIGQHFDESQWDGWVEKKFTENNIYYIVFNQDYRRDKLTNLYHRDALDDVFNKLIATMPQFICVLIDLDNLKAANDKHGHHYGDQQLKILANYLSKQFRQDDTLLRYGGDEFLLLLPIAENTMCETLIKLINQRLKGSPVTISWGIAHYPSDAIAQNELINCADKHLYQMKNNKTLA